MPGTRTGNQRDGGATISPDLVLRRNTSFDAAGAGLRPDEAALLELVDGQRTVNELLHESHLSGSVTMRLLRSLSDRGAVLGAREGSTGGRSRPTGGYATQDLTSIVPLVRDVQEMRDGHKGTPMPADAQAATPGRTDAPETAPPSTASGSIEAPARPEPVVPSGPKIAMGETPAPFRFVPGTPPPVGVSPAPAQDIEGVGSQQRPISVGPYRVIMRIAKGGFGSVYLARRRGPFGFERLFSLKVIRQYAAQETEALKAFEREARIGARLSHPNTQAVHHVGSHEGHPYLILDYVEGANLQDLLVEGRPTPAPLVVAVVADVLRGLQYVHEMIDEHEQPMQLVHGDVSTENILVGLDGAARLSDFGSVRSANSSGGPGSGPAVGKPGFMTPEQLQGERVDARADIFSMGIVLWTALTGKRLFADASFEATIMNVLRKPIEPPSAHGAPPCLDDLCLRALARSPAGRFPTAEQMRLALMKAAAQNGLLASSGDVTEWVRRAVGDSLSERRRRVLAETSSDPTPSSGASREAEAVVTEPRPRRRTPLLPGQRPTVRLDRVPDTMEIRSRRDDAVAEPADTDSVGGDQATAGRRATIVLVALGAAVAGGLLTSMLRPTARPADPPRVAEPAPAATAPVRAGATDAGAVR